MKGPIKRAWTEALRSDRYPQGRGVLRDGDRFCVLGVLCDLAVRAGVIEQTTAASGVTAYAGRISTLPPDVARWAGIKDGGIVKRDRVSIAHLNDEGATFALLADVIERQL